MSEQVMTVQEIESKFRDEWILIADPQTDDALEVTQGQVVSHSRDRDEVYRCAVASHLKRSAILYTGKMPEGTEIVL